VNSRGKSRLTFSALALYGRLLVTLLIAALMTPLAAATETTGTILGVVKDASEAVVAGAKITVRNKATQDVRTAISEHDGSFVFPLLEPGRYEISIEAAGFRKFVDTDESLTVGQNLRLTPTLAVGTAQQKVEVLDQAAQVDTSTAQVGMTQPSEQVATLPLLSRNFIQLTNLQAGVTAPIQIVSAETPRNLPGGIGVSPNVNGLRNNANNYLLDGSDNNEPFLGVAAVVPSVDSIQELQIITGLYPAEYGRSGGSVVNIVTKSGGNRYHGSVWDFLRNDALNARNYFATSVSPFKRNQFGATFGGPLVKNKTFFFGSYEGIRQTKGETTHTTVPSLAERQGDFSALNPAPVACTDPGAVCDPATGLPFTGNKIPSTRFDPAAQLLLSLWPAGIGGSNDFVSQPGLPSNSDQFSVKIDQTFRGADRVSARYFFDQGTSIVNFQPTFFGPVSVPGFPAKDFFRLQNLVFEETHLVSQNVFNEFRASYNRAHLIAGKNLATRLPSDYGFKFQPNEARFFPDVGVTGFSAIGTSDFDNVDRFNNVYDLQDNVAIVHGRHSFKTGLEYLRMRLNNDTPSNQPFFLFLPTFTGNAFGDFLLGDSSVLVSGGGSTRRDYTSNKYNLYFQDRLRVSSKVNLDFGLRYELRQPWLEQHGLVSIFSPGVQSKVKPTLPPGPLYPGDPGVPQRGTFTNTKDFAPRIGFTIDPKGDGKTSIRGGYGIYYDAGDFNSERFQSLVTPGFFDFLLLFGASLSDPYPAFGFTSRGPWASENVNNTLSNPPPSSQINATNAHLPSAYVQQYGLSVQRQLVSNYTLEIGYMGNTSRKLIGTIDLNQPFLTPKATALDEQNRRPFQPWGTINYQFAGLNSSYNGLQVTMEKRLSSGLFFRGAYSWSHGIDYGSIPETFEKAVGQSVFPQNGRNIAAEKGDSAFDTRHRVVLSYFWEIPAFKHSKGGLQRVLGNWSLAGITTLQKGFPITVVDGSDPSLTGEFADRPDVICDPNTGPRTVQKWFNTGCFQQAGPFGGPNKDGYGNAGRNIVRSPGLTVFDFSVIKHIAINESANLEFRSEFFNVLNHPNFGPPGNDISAPQTFGAILNTRPDDERQIQFALKLRF
jgi:hypothetical protein